MEIWKFSDSKSLRFDEKLCGVVCTSCGLAFRTDTDTLGRHLRSTHSMDGPHTLSILKCVKKEAAKIVVPHRLQQKYWEPDGTVLQRVLGIPVFNGFRCLYCPVVSSSASSLQKHICKMHQRAVHLTHIRTKAIVKAQKLRSFPGRHTTYEVWKASEQSPQNKGSYLEPVNSHETKANERYITDFFEDDQDKEGTVRPSQYVGAYTRLAEISERSEVLSTSLDQAADLRRGCVEPTDSFLGLNVTALKNAIRVYATTSINRAKSGILYPGELRRLSSPGAQATLRDVCLNLSPSTLRKYSSQVFYLLLALFRLSTDTVVLPNFPFPISLRKKSMALLASFSNDAEPDESNDQQNLHSVLFEVLVVQEGDRLQPKNQFMYGYILCLSATNRDRDGLRVPASHRRGIDVSPAVAALLYFGSMAAITAVSKASAQNRSSTFHKLTAVYEPGSSSIVGLLSKIRSICSSLRTQETVCISTRSCHMFDHVGCIAVKNTHLSVSKVGDAIKAMHEKVRELERNLTFDFELPDRLLRGIDSLSEDPTIISDGYSFVSDNNNRDFIREYRLELSSVVGSRFEKSPELRKKWLKDGYMLAKVIITLLYIGGGAPGRCTELASLNFKNSTTAKRNVFVNGQEVIISPEHAKQSIIKQGLHESILRFLDVDSGRCYKRFIILYLPMMRKLLQQDISSPTIFVHSPWISNPQGVINEGLKLHGIPMTTRLYRQWYGWYAKTRSSATKASLLYSEDCRRKDVSTEVLCSNVMSRQSGHSDRTALMSYGRGEGVAGVDRGDGVYTTKLFREASRIFHEDCGLLTSSSTRD